MATRQATTVIGHYKFCPHCGTPDPFTLSASWPHGKCRRCGAEFSDSRTIVAIPIFVHRNAVCTGIRGKGIRTGLLNLPGGHCEEHTDPELVATAVANLTRRLTFDNIVDGESIIDAAHAELVEETGYVGPPLKGRIYLDRLATSRHERLVFVILVVENDAYADADPTGWFDSSAVKTPGEFHDPGWSRLNNLAPAEEWAFPIFHEVLSSLDLDPFPLRPRNVRTYQTTAD